MSEFFECQWKNCDDWFDNQLQLDHHVTLEHCEYGVLLKRSKNGLEKTFPCNFGDCEEKFYNELEMNVHVMQTHIQTSFVLPLGNLKPVVLTPTNPPSEESSPKVVTVENESNENKDNDDDEDEPPRKTYRLSNQRPIPESQSSWISYTDTQRTKDYESPDGSVMDSQESNYMMGKVPEYEARQCLEDSNFKYLKEDTTERPFHMPFSLACSPNHKFVCRVVGCITPSVTAEEADNHFRLVHLKLPERVEGRIYGRKTEKIKYDQLKSQGLILRELRPRTSKRLQF